MLKHSLENELFSTALKAISLSREGKTEGRNESKQPFAGAQLL
jgi:hypothetical protein